MGEPADLPPLPPDHQRLLDFALTGLRDAAELVSGVGRAERLNKQARTIIVDALARYDGPCSQAYGDLLHAYICAPPGGRDALFLATAYRAVGCATPSSTPTAPASPGAAARALLPENDRALAEWARTTLDLLARLMPQARS